VSVPVQEYPVDGELQPDTVESGAQLRPPWSGGAPWSDGSSVALAVHSLQALAMTTAAKMSEVGSCEGTSECPVCACLDGAVVPDIHEAG